MVLHWVAMYAHNNHAAASLVRVSYSSVEKLHYKKLISCTACHHTHLAYDAKRVIFSLLRNCTATAQESYRLQLCQTSVFRKTVNDALGATWCTGI